MNPEAGIPAIETPGMDHSIKVKTKPVDIHAYEEAVNELAALARPYRPQHVENILMELKARLSQAGKAPIAMTTLGKLVPEGIPDTRVAPEPPKRSPLRGPDTSLSEPPEKQTGSPPKARKKRPARRS